MSHLSGPKKLVVSIARALRERLKYLGSGIVQRAVQSRDSLPTEMS